MRINENQLRRLVRNILDEGHPYVSPGNAETYNDIDRQIKSHNAAKAAEARSKFEKEIRDVLEKAENLNDAQKEMIFKNLMVKYDSGRAPSV